MAMDKHDSKRVKLGKIGFLNVLPIYYPIESGRIPSDCELVTGPPAHLNKQMAAGRLDISPVSSIEAARHADRYFLVPDLSISCRGPVRSVLLLSRVPVQELAGRSVLVTAKSQTSIALLKLLASLRWGMQKLITYKGCVTETLRSGQRPDAFLAIGDEALRYRRHPDYPYRTDLGQAWFDWTGLPFVFGLWTVRRDSLAIKPHGIQQAVSELMAAKQWGAAHRPRICRAAVQISGFDPACLADYYRHLCFDLGGTERVGLQHFFRLLYQANELPSVPELEPLTQFARVA